MLPKVQEGEEFVTDEYHSAKNMSTGHHCIVQYYTLGPFFHLWQLVLWLAPVLLGLALRYIHVSTFNIHAVNNLFFGEVHGLLQAVNAN